MRARHGGLGIVVTLLAACGDAPAPAPPPAPVIARPNPLIAPSALPLHAPPFDQIRADDFPAAYAEGIRAQNTAVRAIVDDPAPPTFDNTIVALDRSRELLEHVERLFDSLDSAVASPALDQIAAATSPVVAHHGDDIKLDAKLFQRVHAVYLQRDKLGLDAEDRQLLELTHRDFVRGGALLAPVDQALLRALDAEEASLEAEYTRRLAADTDAHALVVDKQDDLLGLPWRELKAAAAEAATRHQPGLWIVPLTSGTSQATSALVDRALREHVQRTSMLRGHHGDANDTRATIARIAQIRAMRAQLLGFASYAALVLDGHMAKTSTAVTALLDEVAAAAVPRARDELAALQKSVDRDGDHFELAAWDVQHYANAADMTATPSELFELDRVLTDGVFHAAHQLYGVTFVRRTDFPVYQPDVQVWEARDADGSVLGLLYLDLFAREGKRGGAWTFPLTAQSTRFGAQPIMTTNLNIPKPAAGQRLFLGAAEVETLFHECGHALDGLLAKVKSPRLAGLTTPMDYIEFPSQLMESWAFDPVLAAHYASYDPADQAKLPAVLAALDRPRRVDAGISTVSQLQSTYLDLAWHALPASAPLQDPDMLEAATFAAHAVDLPPIAPEYRSTYFSHIWTDGYAAGYYGYLWAKVLAWDAHAWFVAHGGLTAANGKRFRDLVLARGSSVDPHAAYVEFLGGEPSVTPMLEHLGLVAPGK